MLVVEGDGLGLPARKRSFFAARKTAGYVNLGLVVLRSGIALRNRIGFDFAVVFFSIDRFFAFDVAVARTCLPTR